MFRKRNFRRVYRRRSRFTRFRRRRFSRKLLGIRAAMRKPIPVSRFRRTAYRIGNAIAEKKYATLESTAPQLILGTPVWQFMPVPTSVGVTTSGRVGAKVFITKWFWSLCFNPPAQSSPNCAVRMVIATPRKSDVEPTEANFWLAGANTTNNLTRLIDFKQWYVHSDRIIQIGQPAGQNEVGIYANTSFPYNKMIKGMLRINKTYTWNENTANPEENRPLMIFVAGRETADNLRPSVQYSYITRFTDV